MSKKQNKNINELWIGLDTLEIDINTEYEIVENTHDFISSKTGLVIGTLKYKQGKQHGYRLNICLPKCVHETNVKPLSVLDVYHLFEITQMIEKEMQQLFGENYPELVVSMVEVNTTVMLKNKENVNPLMNMLAMMLLDKDEKLCLWGRGKKTGERYKKVSSLYSGMQVESIHTERLSNSRMSVKFYNKTQEINDKMKEQENKEQRGIIRLEFRYNKSGINFAKAGKTLKEFLTVNSMKKMIEMYRKDYKQCIVNRFWNNTNGTPFYEQCITIIFNDLQRLEGQPLTVALINKSLIELDYSLFEKACRRYYEKEDSARHAIRRVKQSGEIQINEGVFDDFVALSKAIIYG